MIQITDNIWIGNSDDEKNVNLEDYDIGAVLNVANDMQPVHDWDKYGIGYMHIGLVDGPGNPASTYTTVILAIAALIEKRQKVLICCHTMSRSLAVVIMYLIIKSGKNSKSATFFNYWIPWDKMVEDISSKVIDKLPRLHKAHKEVFDKMPLSLIEVLV